MVSEYLAEGTKPGDIVEVSASVFNPYTREPDKKVRVKVIETYQGGSIKVEGDVSYREPVIIGSDQYEKSLLYVGADPFPEKSWQSDIRTYNYDISGIMCMLGVDMFGERGAYRDRDYTYKGVEVSDVNVNPYVIDKDGNRQYYQREYCWTLEQKQLLIESIYQSINCGTIVVRKRSFKYIESEIDKGNTDVAFIDIVDGKQRYNALREFVMDEYPDLHGNYYSDLSDRAKMKFRGSQMLTLGEMGEFATDEDVIATFLKVNYAGVPMSREHIEYVKEIQGKLNN